VLEKQVQKANEQIEMQIKATELKETTIKQLREDVAGLERKVEALNVCIEQLRHANDRLEEDLHQRMIEANEYAKQLINEKAEVEVELERVKEALSNNSVDRLENLQGDSTKIEKQIYKIVSFRNFSKSKFSQSNINRPGSQRD
jgi:chromosome segregation ATPase